MLEEWQRLGLDLRQFAYGKWWTREDQGGGLEWVALDPQPAPPSRDADGMRWL